MSPKVAVVFVVFARSGSEGLHGSGNTGAHAAGFLVTDLLVNKCKVSLFRSLGGQRRRPGANY
jgi:hypothetical protein